MHIVGTGMDAIEIDRIAAALGRFGDRFLRRIYTPGEIAYCRARGKSAAASFAARFAAKEAAMKALGTGRSRGVLWKDVEVVRQPGGPPQLQLHGGAARRAHVLGIENITLTLTHARSLALAHVIALRP